MKRRFLLTTLIGLGVFAFGVTFLSQFVSRRETGGFFLKTYSAPDGSTHKYSVFVPLSLDEDEKPPLIVYLNGFGKNGNDGLLPLRDGLAPVIWENKRSFPFVVVFPQCNEGSYWNSDGPDAQRALAIIETTEDEYGTDPDRVSLMGLSTGGAGVWSIAAAYPERFSAIAPMSALPVDSNQLDSIIKHQMPSWSFYVADDPQIPKDRREAVRTKLVAGGLSPKETVTEGTAHKSWDIAFRTPAFFAWLLDQRRSQNPASQGRFHLLETNESLDGWRPHREAIWSVDPDGIMTGRTEEDQSAGYLTTEDVYEDVDFHIGFKMMGTRECALSFRADSEEDDGKAWTFLAMTPELGSGGLFDDASGEWLAPTNALAQQALRPDGWNDCRIRKAGSRILIELNGWKAIDYKSDSLPRQGVFALSTPQDQNAQILWREPHVRVIDN